MIYLEVTKFSQNTCIWDVYAFLAPTIRSHGAHRRVAARAT